MWSGWLRRNEVCEVCGLRFDRGEPDYFIGAYLFNLIAAELTFGALFTVLLIALWPTPPWTLLTWVGVIGAAISPIVLYPVSYGVWLAVDLVFRPDRRDREI